MRTTLRIDDSLLRELKRRAVREKTSLTQIVNRVLQSGLAADSRKAKSPRQRFRQETFDMGPPKFDINKALAFAGELEDEEILKKLARGK